MRTQRFDAISRLAEIANKEGNYGTVTKEMYRSIWQR